MRVRSLIVAIMTVAMWIVALPKSAAAQVNTVRLSGVVLDPQDLPVKDAHITLKNAATSAERATTSDASGRYELVGLQPGTYSMTVESAGFATLTNQSLTLELGVLAEYNLKLQVRTATATVTVTSNPDLVETGKTDISTTITQNQIDNLPINGRNYINFTLLNSQAARDETPSIGAAPTSGLNFGGQRARSNEVSIDGADAVDDTTGGVRATVSQEAVQEFQVITSNYMPEYGRAMGGVVNIVTKSGSNAVHGDVFGFLRDSAIQAQNPFSVAASFDPTTQTFGTVPVKQSYTRVQAGATIGGPIQKDKTFYFFSYEITRRQETGFSSIGADNFGLVPTAVPGDIEPFLPTGTPTSGYLTQPQVTFVDNTANPFADRVNVYALGVGSSAVAIFGNTPGFPANFFPNIFGFASPAPLPTSYHGLASVIGNFPTSEGTSLWSLRLDHIWNAANSSFIRADVSPSTITGIEVNAQNQNFGQNAGSRTSDQQTRDLAIIAQHTTAISPTLFNEARFQFARRGLHYGYSDLPGGGDPAIDLTGYAFFGREPFSVEDRTEKRYQFTDNLSWTKGTHSMKFGADFNLIQLGTTKDQTFTLNYGGVYDFAGLSASSFGINSPNAPGFSAIQAYGLGLPESFYQGIGSTNRPFDDKSLGVFAQDSWKISKRLTLNYGVRYDIEFLPIFPASTSINQIAEKALGVVEGIPTDSNNVAPRIGVAWDPFGDGKTIIRAGYGFFYDHPALALAFLSTTFDGAQSSLLEAAGGTPSYASLDNPANFPALNAASIFQGTLTGAITGCSTNTATPQMCYQANEQRFSTTYGNSLFNNQNFLPSASNPVGFPLPLLPYTIPITKNFQNALAQQANLTVERQLANDWKVSAGYTYTHGTHLDRTININVANPALLVENAYNGELTGYISPASNPQGVAVPSTVNTACPGGIPAYNVPGAGSIAFATPTGEPLAPSILGYGYTGQNCSGTPVGFVASAAVFNFFRKSGPNPSFAGLVPGGYNTLVGLASIAGLPTGFSGIQVPWSDVNPETSTGNSLYNAFTLTVTKRFSHGTELLSSWTYSHTIDDSTDLSTLLNPQDNSNPNGDRGNSDFDQRHRWITSAVMQSPYRMHDEGFWKKALADFTVAPVIEVASGRPYNVLIGTDTNLDFGTATNRPDAYKKGQVPAGLPIVDSPFLKNVDFTIPTSCLDTSNQPFGPFPAFVASPPYGCVGTLGRNAFTKPGFFQIDLRIARTIAINERVNLQIIADGFNMLNRLNVTDVNPLCDPTSNTCTAGTPTSSADPRTFQFALKVIF
jgi:hypothetical protein